MIVLYHQHYRCIDTSANEKRITGPQHACVKKNSEAGALLLPNTSGEVACIRHLFHWPDTLEEAILLSCECSPDQTSTQSLRELHNIWEQHAKPESPYPFSLLCEVLFTLTLTQILTVDDSKWALMLANQISPWRHHHFKPTFNSYFIIRTQVGHT